MNYKVRGNAVIFMALEVKTDSGLILKAENKEHRLIIKYLGSEAPEDLKVGDEILLKNVEDKSVVELDNNFYWMTTPYNVLAIVEGNTIETYTYEETIDRAKTTPIVQPVSGGVFHNNDIILSNS